jgi:hypothetical protein
LAAGPTHPTTDLSQLDLFSFHFNLHPSTPITQNLQYLRLAIRFDPQQKITIAVGILILDPLDPTAQAIRSITQ